MSVVGVFFSSGRPKSFTTYHDLRLQVSERIGRIAAWARILDYEPAQLQKFLRGLLRTRIRDSAPAGGELGWGRSRRAETPHATWCYARPHVGRKSRQAHPRVLPGTGLEALPGVDEVDHDAARHFYEIEAEKERWSAIHLER